MVASAAVVPVTPMVVVVAVRYKTSSSLVAIVLLPVVTSPLASVVMIDPAVTVVPLSGMSSVTSITPMNSLKSMLMSAPVINVDTVPVVVPAPASSALK